MAFRFWGCSTLVFSLQVIGGLVAYYANGDSSFAQLVWAAAITSLGGYIVYHLEKKIDASNRTEFELTANLFGAGAVACTAVIFAITTDNAPMAAVLSSAAVAASILATRQAFESGRVKDSPRAEYFIALPLGIGIVLGAVYLAVWNPFMRVAAKAG